jgi:hypothetical protein
MHMYRYIKNEIHLVLNLGLGDSYKNVALWKLDVRILLEQGKNIRRVDCVLYSIKRHSPHTGDRQQISIGSVCGDFRPASVLIMPSHGIKPSMY